VQQIEETNNEPIEEEKEDSYGGWSYGTEDENPYDIIYEPTTNDYNLSIDFDVGDFEEGTIPQICGDFTEWIPVNMHPTDGLPNLFNFH